MDTIYFRKIQPSGAHKSYRFQKKESENASRETISNDEIQALNRAIKDKKSPLSERDIEVRAEVILQNLYRERDKDKPVDVIAPGNEKLFEDWWAKTYTPAKIKRQKYSPGYRNAKLASGRSFRILTIIDEWSRECPTMEVDTSLSGHRVVRVLEKLKAEWGLPEEIGVDQGPELISKALTKSALDNGVRLHYASPGDKNENAFIESFNGRLRDECLNMFWFSNLKDARDIVEDWRIDYNERRPYTSLGGMIPSKFAETKGLRLAG